VRPIRRFFSAAGHRPDTDSEQDQGQKHRGQKAKLSGNLEAPAQVESSDQPTAAVAGLAGESLSAE
jgi:hypothetical protein